MADFDVTTTNFSSGTLIKSSEVNTNFDNISAVFNGDRNQYNPVPSLVPVGAIVAWAKTLGTADSGTTDGTSANKLIQSGQNFQTTVLVGMIVFNSTDSTFANVTAVDSNTQLTLDADIMVSGEAFTIYKTPKLPDGWLECNGATVSDADSPFNGVVIPNLNGTTDATRAFIRGVSSAVTGTTVTDVTHTHSVNIDPLVEGTGELGSGTADGDFANPTGNQVTSGSERAIPPYVNMVFIIRIK